MYEQEKNPSQADVPASGAPASRRIKRICVYCGGKSGFGAEYLQAADQLGNELLRQDISLVFGGGGTGLMGRIADCVVGGGGQAIGIIPRSILSVEPAHKGVSELKIVGSMHERKALMAELSDGFIAMPGGLGTLEELFETLTWAQLKFHHKPCGVFNARGYYDHLAGFLDQAVDKGFVKPTHRRLMLMENNPARLLERMEEFAAAR